MSAVIAIYRFLAQFIQNYFSTQLIFEKTIKACLYRSMWVFFRSEKVSLPNGSVLFNLIFKFTPINSPSNCLLTFKDVGIVYEADCFSSILGHIALSPVSQFIVCLIMFI